MKLQFAVAVAASVVVCCASSASNRRLELSDGLWHFALGGLLFRCVAVRCFPTAAQ